MPVPTPNTTAYAQRKRRFGQLLTVYGRKPVLEALQDASIPVYRLHLADSNRADGIITDILALARNRGIEIAYHSRLELSRISRDQRQDQGVAVDLRCPRYGDFQSWSEQPAANEPFRLLALDRVTNPQNLGMIVRSVCASPLTALLLPAKGCAPLSPLVIKASAGALLRCPILRCGELPETLGALAARGADICVLAAAGREALGRYQPRGAVVYVLGNETEGVSPAVAKCATHHLHIPMANGVESLNVAVTAALIAFQPLLTTGCA